MATSPDRKELKAKWKNEVEVKTYNKKEIAKHNTKRDLWVIIHGKVYNVTEYVRDHPGGVDVLVEVAGQDATSAYEDVGHSEDAGEIMQAYLVGVLEGATVGESTTSTSPTQPNVQIVRRHTPPESKATTNKLINPRTELAAFAVGTAGLVWYLTSSQILPSFHMTGTEASKLLGGHGGFTQGFLTACVTLGGIGAASIRHISNASKFKGGFTSYPAHIQSTSPKSSYRPTGVLHPSEYHSYKLRRKEELSDGIYRFVFDLPAKHSILGLPIGQHIAIRATVGDHTVVRSYTPISNNRDLGKLELIVRVYPDGQLGNVLKNLNVGDVAQIRGPKGAMKYRKGMSKSIGMIGGGTGITPLYQLIRSICENPNDDTQVSLIYGNRSESDIMLRKELDHFAKVASHKFKLHYVLDKPGPGWEGGTGHVTPDLVRSRMPAPSNDTKILLCGPPGMVNAMKKNLVDMGFEGPGAVSKMSDQIFCF